MSHLNPGLISAYNSLTDKHLAGYFSNTRIRRHLQRAGLITRSGRIVPDKEYRHKLIQRAHQRHIRECLAQAIFHKVLEMERIHQIEIKRRLEEFARRERVHKIKVERSKRYEEDIIRILSPRPPTGARGIRKQHSGPEGEHSESSESPGSSRPNTAPGKMQRPVRLKPIHSNSTTASLRRSSPYRLLESSNENNQPFNCTMDKDSRRRLTAMEPSHGISPYCLPVINNFVTPVPPATKRKERGVKVTASGTLRGRRLRPTTASSGADVNEEPTMLRSSVHQSRVSVNMMYFGKTVHLSHDLTDLRDEVKVFQQHCGGENLCVYKGMLREGDTFQFISRRHRGFPFSLTFFLNGLQVERLSSCCEFKHRKGSRLGGRHGHFGFCSVEGASPCYKCIIAMGLDKKPTPPPKRVKEDGGREDSLLSPKDAPEIRTESTAEEAASPCETSQQQDLESQVKEETAAEEDKVRDDYEEDFEADDEGPAEDAEAKEEKSPSPFSETQTQVKERDASETEDYEKDDDTKSHSASSYSGSDQEESDSEAPKDSREEEKAEQPEEVDQEESVVPPDKKDEPDPEEATATEAESAVAKDSDVQNSAWDSTEIDISDTSVPSGNETKQNDDISGDREAEKIVDESKQEEEQERAKSVQEKLAEAILKESQCSSEPELSDTSTEEEEESTDKGPGQDNKDAVQEKSVTFTEQQQTIVEETKCDEGVVGGAEVTQGQGETPDPKEQEDETELLPQHTSDFTKDEKVKTDEEDEKASLEESTAENAKLEDTEDTGLHPVSEEDMAEDDRTSEPQEDTAAKSTDSGDEDEEKTAVKVDTQCDEAGKGAKSSKEDESLVSEPDKKTDETAAPDNAEAEAMTVSETIEMKAEPSEEREALSCEEAPVTDTDRAAASETEVTAENSSSSLEGSGDTTVEKTAETSGDNAKDEGNKDDIEEEESEEALDDRKNDNHQERCEQGEELTVKGVERDDGAEERSEEEGKEEEKQTNPDDITGGDNGEENKANEKDKTEEDENNGTKTEERLENEEEMTKSDSNTEQKADEQAEETHSEGDKVKAEESVDESEKKEKDEDGECVRDKNDEEESEEKGPETDENNEGGKFSETNPAAAEKNEDAEKQEKEQKENKAEEEREDEKNKDAEESEARRVLTDVTVEGEEISVTTEEPEKSADTDLGRDHVKISDESVVESEDVSEVADVAQGTKTPDEEAEDVKKETEKVSDNTENEEIDAENGEISTEAGNKTQEDEGDAQSEGKNEEETGEGTEGEIKTEKPTEDEGTVVKEVTMESGEAGEKCEDVKVEQSPDTDLVESDAMERDDDAAKQDESPTNIAEPETSGVEIKEESETHDKKDCEETKQDENGNISDPGHENRDSDLIKKNDNVTDVTVASSSDLEQSSAPIALDLNDAAQKSDEFTEQSDSKTDKHPYTDENAAAVADASAGDGENEETEDASKASEEGASVLLKPQAQSSTQVQNNKAENTEENDAVSKETPDALATEDNTDLVTNWVAMHQASKFFETFVEPLEDLKESDVQLSNSDKEAAPSAELLRSMSPLKMMKMSENAEQMPNDANDPKGQAVESELESNHCEGVEPCEKDSIKDTLNVEETEVKDLTQEAEGEENDKESVKGQDVTLEEHKERRGSPEVDKDDLMQDNIEQTDVSKTEVESIADTHHSVASGRPEKVSETQTEEKITDIDPDLKEKQTPVEEITDLLPSSETEERCEPLTSPGGFSELKANNPSIIEETLEKSGEVTETTDFTEDGSQEESCHTEAHPKPSDESIKGDRRDSQLIQDFQQTLSKDQLSTFSVDETLFGRSSYPLLTAARTESGH